MKKYLNKWQTRSDFRSFKTYKHKFKLVFVLRKKIKAKLINPFQLIWKASTKGEKKQPSCMSKMLDEGTVIADLGQSQLGQDITQCFPNFLREGTLKNIYIFYISLNKYLNFFCISNNWNPLSMECRSMVSIAVFGPRDPGSNIGDLLLEFK